MISVPLADLTNITEKTARVYLFSDKTTSALEVVIYKQEKDRALVSAGLEKGDQVIILTEGNVPTETTILNK